MRGHELYLSLDGYTYEAHFECHDILMLGKSPIKWRQCPDMTIAVDWDVKHQFKQTDKIYCDGSDMCIKQKFFV